MKTNKETLKPVISALQALLSIAGYVSDVDIIATIRDTFPDLNKAQLNKAVRITKSELGYGSDDSPMNTVDSCGQDESYSYVSFDNLRTRYSAYLAKPRYSAEEEQEVFHEYIAEKDPTKKKRMRNDIILHYTYLAVSFGYKYINRYPDLEMVDVGVEGIIEAIDKFNPELGYRFSTYCIHWIKQKITLELNIGFPITIPTYIQARINKIKKYVSKFYNENGYYPSEEFLAKEFDLSIGVIRDILNDIYIATVPIDTSGETDEADEKPGVIPVGKDNIVSMIEANERNTILRKAVDSLDPRKRYIVIEKIGLDDGIPKTNPEIASKLNISRETVRTDYLQALKILRKNSDIINLKPFMDDDPSLF